MNISYTYFIFHSSDILCYIQYYNFYFLLQQSNHFQIAVVFTSCYQNIIFEVLFLRQDQIHIFLQSYKFNVHVYSKQQYINNSFCKISIQVNSFLFQSNFQINPIRSRFKKKLIVLLYTCSSIYEIESYFYKLFK